MAAERLPGIPSGIEPIRKVLMDLAARHGRIKFAAIKPALERQLNRPFDPNVFNCSNTGDFLRDYAEDLGIVVQKGEDDWEICPLPPQEVKQTPIAPTTASTQDMTLYRDLLKETRIHIVRKSDWQKITELIYQYLVRSPNAKPPTFYYRKLQDQLVEQAKERGVSIPELKVASVMHQLFNTGCFVSDVSEGPEPETMFSWDEPASLHPELSSLDHIQVRVTRYLIGLLLSRGKARNPAFSVDPTVLATLLCDTNPARGDVDQMKQSIGDTLTEMID